MRKQSNANCPYSCSFVRLRCGTTSVCVREWVFLMHSTIYIYIPGPCAFLVECVMTFTPLAIYILHQQCFHPFTSPAISPSCILLFKPRPPASVHLSRLVLYSCQLNSTKHTHFTIFIFHSLSIWNAICLSRRGPCCFHGPLCCLVNARLFPWEIKEWLWAFSAPQNCVTL